MKQDEFYMARCIELARKGAGSVSTNPMVGAVVVHDGKIIGEGWHRKFGEAHAEVNAVDSVENQALLAESVLYVSLEPCSHHGKTPPCSDLIIRKGIRRVVVGMQDPFSLVAGRGIARMREAGIDVTVGVLEAECRFLNRRFITFHTRKRPYVIVKYARTADGYLDNDRNAATPASWMTGPACRVLVHRWRSEEDAIMVGTNTVLRDDPELTVRECNGRNPLRVTVDRHGRIPPDARIRDGRAETLVFTGESLPEMMAALWERGVQSLFVEGGRALIESFSAEGYVDEVREFVSPMMLSDLKGGSGKGGVPAPRIDGMSVLSREWVGEVELTVKIRKGNGF